MPTIVSPPCQEEDHPVSEPRALTLELTEHQYIMYTNNRLMQHRLPDQSAEARERFISGTCPTCWDRIFASEDDKR